MVDVAAAHAGSARVNRPDAARASTKHVEREGSKRVYFPAVYNTAVPRRAQSR